MIHVKIGEVFLLDAFQFPPETKVHAAYYDTWSHMLTLILTHPDIPSADGDTPQTAMPIFESNHCAWCENSKPAFVSWGILGAAEEKQ